MVAWTSLRRASGQALNSSGGTILPSCIGASAKPNGVRMMATLFSFAFSLSAENASLCFLWNSSSIDERRV